MKTNPLSLLLASALAVFAASPKALAEATSPKEAFVRMAKLAQKLESEGKQVVFAKLDTIRKNHPSMTTVTLAGSQHYFAFALGDEVSSVGVNLAVSDENDGPLGATDGEESSALVKFSPSHTGAFQFKVNAPGIKKVHDDAFYGIVIACSAPDAAPTASILTQMEECLKRAASVGAPVRYCQMHIVDRAAPAAISYPLEEGVEYAILARGDGDRILDLDMTVLDENDGLVARDDDESNAPGVFFTPQMRGDYRIVLDASRLKKGVGSGFYCLVILSKPQTDAGELAML